MANEKRLIDAWRLVIDLAKLKKCGQYDHDDVLAVIASQKTVEAVEVVHGRLGVSYIDEYYGEFADCLQCGTDNILPCHYCRNCGAKMDGDGNG